MQEFYIIFIAIALIYVSLIPAYYFLINERLKMLDAIVMSKNMKKRSKLVEMKIEANKDMNLAFFWPVLVVRAITDARKQKK
jgi:hypothetical protein